MSNDDAVTLKLRVTEALGKDVGRAFARMDPEDLQRLGLAIGEIVEVGGKRTTVCKAMLAPHQRSPTNSSTTARQPINPNSSPMIAKMKSPYAPGR